MASPSGSISSIGTPFIAAAKLAPLLASTPVLNKIHRLVPVSLATDDGNFRQWRSFEPTFKKFGLMNHIDGMVDAATMFDDPEWL
jgi:hypothetical protein